MYYCKECERVLDYLNTYQETHGLDTPPYETSTCCPYCGSIDIAEAALCDICEDVFDEEELKYGVCPDCYEKYCKDFKSCWEVSKLCAKEDVQINPLLSSLFTNNEIETILYDYLKSCKEVDCKEFIDCDPEGFFEILKDII